MGSSSASSIPGHVAIWSFLGYQCHHIKDTEAREEMYGYCRISRALTGGDLDIFTIYRYYLGAWICGLAPLSKHLNHVFMFNAFRTRRRNYLLYSRAEQHLYSVWCQEWTQVMKTGLKSSVSSLVKSATSFSFVHCLIQNSAQAISTSY